MTEEWARSGGQPATGGPERVLDASRALVCTERELPVKLADAKIPVLPCTSLHVQAALARALT